MDQPSAMPAQAGHTKQYVFVDEYNRHKRLKVMRACDGCRKRKIRCDGALQNGPWPCGSCLRLKLKCVPPTVDQDDDQQTVDAAVPPGQGSFQISNTSGNSKPPDPSLQPTMIHEWGMDSRSASFSTPGTSSTLPPQPDFHPSDYASRYYQYSGLPPEQGYVESDYAWRSRSSVGSGFERAQTEGSSSSGDPQEVSDTVRELSSQMGDLSIHPEATAPYIANQKRELSELPPVEDKEMILPPSAYNQSTIKIPHDMMLGEGRAMDYFAYFFSHVHPYMPVLNRTAFFEQWRTSRDSISPLLLEGIFACVARYLEPPIEARKWLALATKHEESYRDVPRLSTLQSMLILTKAREFAPKRGYYYRSWMAVKYMTTMAIDLGLHEHHDRHRPPSSCKLSRTECMLHTRIWQVLLWMEMMVGGPQGRTDYVVDLDTVDFVIPPTSQNDDAFEYHSSRRSTFLTQAVGHIKQTNNLWLSIRKYKKDWSTHPPVARQSDVLREWMNNLPPDMQVHYDESSNPPFLGLSGGDHFIACMHTYYHLVVLVHHRPQLQALLERQDPNFKIHLDICNESASKMCRLQEALLRDYGLHGLSFMNRGIGYTIYCVLTCTMLHLATITSPDPIANSNARMYFTRHMRILEQCQASAPAEMQTQIQALKDAFSVDTTKPFQLKTNLGLRSPAMASEPTPPGIKASLQNAHMQEQAWSHIPDPKSAETMGATVNYRSDGHQMPTSTPPLQYNSQTDFGMPAQASLTQTNLHQMTSAPSTYAMEPVISSEQTQSVWDPSGIFNQWNTAFGPPSQPSQPTHPVQSPHVQPNPTQMMAPQQSTGAQHHMYGSQQISPTTATGVPIVPEPMPSIPTVTPVMWQDAFTNAYVSGHGQKRFREDHIDGNSYQQFSKRRG